MRRSLPGLLLLAACQTYTPKPLDPDQILEEVATRRREAPAGEVLSLRRATELMREHSPRLREARAAHATAHAVAETPTPLPNPAIALGPTVLVGGAIPGSDRWGAEAALGWAVMLGGKRRLTDDVNAIRAEAAHVALGTIEREEYLLLRREFLALAAATRAVEARRDLETVAGTSVAIVRRLVEAAQATALDVREFEVEAYEAEASAVEAGEFEAEAQSLLGARTGVVGDVFSVRSFPAMPADLPPLSKLRELMMRDHPELARVRAEYAVAEKELRLEIAGQYPDLDLGITYELEEGVSKWGLGFGIELPIFDRNQPGIARADAHRDEIRVRFEARVNRQLAAIEAARRRLDARLRRLEIMQTKIGPTAERALALARRTLESGAADALRYLTVLRQFKRWRIAILEAELAAYEAWNDLEQACGAPLLAFADAPGAEGENE